MEPRPINCHRHTIAMILIRQLFLKRVHWFSLFPAAGLVSRRPMYTSLLSTNSRTKPKRKKNMRSVFNNVPVEIFRKIMLYAYSYERDSDRITPMDNDLKDIDFQVVLPPIIASHVCRSWRNTLLADPSMWSCLTISHRHLPRRAIPELILRSKQAPLNVYLDLDIYLTKCGDTLNYGTSSLLSALGKEIHRIRLLHVRASEPYLLCGNPKLEEWMDHVLTYIEPTPKLQSVGLWTYKPPEGTRLFFQ